MPNLALFLPLLLASVASEKRRTTDPRGKSSSGGFRAPQKKEASSRASVIGPVVSFGSCSTLNTSLAKTVVTKLPALCWRRPVRIAAVTPALV
jgi:hypothetical protein